MVILSALTYVDQSTCTAAGAVNAQGLPSGCTNYGKWVFSKRLIVGNSNVRSSAIGTPTGVDISSSGDIPVSDYATISGAVATFGSINPYSDVNGTVTGLPSGQVLYIAEAAATEYALAPYAGGATYAFGLF